LVSEARDLIDTIDSAFAGAILANMAHHLNS
jgi:hypothetical protein